MAKIFSLMGEILVDNTNANSAIENTTKKAKDQSQSLGSSVADISKKAIGIGTAIVGASTAIVGGLTAAANKTGEYAGSILDASRETSINTELLQQLKYAGEQSGVGFDALTGSADKLNKKLAEAITGNKASKQSFEDLGIAIFDSSGKARNSSDVYNDTIMKLASMGDSAEANALGNEIFGKSFSNLKPLLAEGAGGIEEFKKQASELGIVMSDDAVKAGDNFSDTLGTLRSSLGGVFNQLMNKIMPILQPILEKIVSAMPTISTWIGNFAPMIMNVFSQLLPPLMQLVQDLFPIILNLIQQLMPPIIQIIQLLLPIFVQLLQILLPPLIQIISAILPPLISILTALMPIIKIVLDLVIWAIDTVLLPIINVIGSIIDLIGKGLVNAINFMTPIVKGVAQIFKDVFGGLFNIVKVPINFIIDGLNKFIGMINKIEIPDWVPGVGGMGINLPTITRLKVGLDYVPYDEFPALLHRGERVMTAQENDSYSSYGSSTNISTSTDNNAILKMLNKIDNHLTSLKIVLDTKKLVGGIAQPMDEALANISNSRRRGR